MGISFGGRKSPESLGNLVLRTNRLARAHMLMVKTGARYDSIWESYTPSRSSVAHPDTRTIPNLILGASSPVQESIIIKPYKEYWDVLGVNGEEVILRRKLLNGVNEEFVLDKGEMEAKGLIGLRAGRRIEVWKDPETGKIEYELQRYTYLKLPPVLQAILDAEKTPQDTTGSLHQQKDTVDTPKKTNNATGENLDPNRTITVNIRGSHGQRERVVASKKDGFDIWACIHGSRAPYHGQCVFRSEFDNSQMISDKSDLLGYFAKGESIKTIQRGDYILVRRLPQRGLQLHKIHEIELNLDFSHLPFSAEELRKYLNS